MQYRKNTQKIFMKLCTFSLAPSVNGSVKHPRETRPFRLITTRTTEGRRIVALFGATSPLQGYPRNSFVISCCVAEGVTTTRPQYQLSIVRANLPERRKPRNGVL